MNLKQILRYLGQRTHLDIRRELPSIASQVDASYIHDAITAASWGRTRELFSIYRDCLVSGGHIQSEFSKRKLAVVNEPMSALAFDKADAVDKQTADTVVNLLDDADTMRGMIHLLDSCLYPVSIVEKVFSVRDDGKIVLSRLVPVPHTLLDYQDKVLKIRDGMDPEDLSKAFVPDTERYIIHRGNLLTMPDCWGGPMRSILFWWLLSTCDRTWWARFLEKYGTPFTVGRYDADDDQSRTILERAFSLATRLGGLIVTRETEIDIKQSSARDSGDAFEKFHRTCDEEISKIVIGQTLSSNAQPTGLGSKTSQLHSDVREDIRRFDALALSITIRKQLFAQLCRINRLPGRVPRCQFGTIRSPDQAESLSKILLNLRQASLEVDDSGLSDLSEVVGLPIRRALTPPPVAPEPFSADMAGQLDAIATRLAPDLVRAFRGRDAEIARIIRESTSHDDCLRRIQAFSANMRPAARADIIHAALVAYASSAHD